MFWVLLQGILERHQKALEQILFWFDKTKDDTRAWIKGKITMQQRISVHTEIPSGVSLHLRMDAENTKTWSNMSKLSLPQLVNPREDNVQLFNKKPHNTPCMMLCMLWHLNWQWWSHWWDAQTQKEQHLPPKRLHTGETLLATPKEIRSTRILATIVTITPTEVRPHLVEL